MRVAVSGASGLVGTALAARLGADGAEVARLVRRDARAPDEIAWDGTTWRADPAGLEGVDAVVHLAGENVGAGRWTAERMERIRSSRLDGTRGVAESIASLERRPSVLVAASAVGWYGDRGDEELDERSSPGEGFLAEVCRGWELAAEPARSVGVRVVHLRFGVVLSRTGGALARMRTPFKLGLGGPLGSGRQWFPWVALDDAVGAIAFALAHDSLEGPVNVVAPGIVTNREFARAFGRALSRPAVAPLPAFAARLLFGKMADEALLASQRARPRALLDAGYAFAQPELDAALAAVAR